MNSPSVKLSEKPGTSLTYRGDSNLFQFGAGRFRDFGRLEFQERAFNPHFRF